MQISILSANMWLLPPPASLDNQKRLKQLTKIVKKLDPDVVNLQEVWLKSYVKQINNLFPKYHFSAPKAWLYNQSGLITLTKHKINNKKIHHFKVKRQYNPIERIARKGFLRVQLEINKKIISIINVHIYHSRQLANLKLKLNQINEVIKVAKENGPSIIAGDLNTPPNYYKNKLKSFLFENTTPETYSEKNKYTHAMVNAIMNKEGVYNPFPDRVLFFPKSTKAKIKTKIIKDPLVSDHYPIYTEVSIS